MTANPVSRQSGLSVVIPSLNRISMLKRACDSVVSNHRNRVEIVVVDDGSDVDLRHLLAPTNSHGIAIRSYRFERNRGPQAARILGIRRAKFSHIAFLDSDDTFTVSKIDIVLAQIDSDSFDLLFHGVLGMPKYGSLARFWTKSLRSWLPFHWWIALLNPVATPALVVRRERRLGVVHLRHCEDWAFLLRYVQSDTRICYLDQNLAVVHRVPGSKGGLSGAVWKMRKGEFAARRVLLKATWPSGFIRFLMGTLAGIFRILNDALRGDRKSVV